MRFLSDDLLEGRETTYPGQKIAARYIAGHLARYGVESLTPEAEEPYYQVFSLYTSGVDTHETVISFEQRKFTLADGFSFFGFHPEPGELSGPLVYIGYAYRSKKHNWDAYEGADLQGKIVVAMDGYPPHLDEQFKDTERRRKHLREKKIKWATKAGAKALIFLPASDFDALDRKPIEEQRDSHGERLSLSPPSLGGTDFPVIDLGEGQAKSFLGEHFERVVAANAAIARDSAPQFLQLGSEDATIKTVIAKKELTTENVVGVIPGTDDTLKKEYLVISAHYDHIGKRGEDIYNGADDNASGTALLIDLARRLAKNPLKRSVVFLALTAEEKGLIGSRIFLETGPLKTEEIIANINLDMVGRNETGSLGMIPARNEDISTLNTWTNEVNQGLEHPFTFIEEFDQYHHRSDHYNFSRRGIPAIFFFAGDHEDYHKATDTWDKVNYEKIVRVGILVEALTKIVGNSPERPVFTNRDLEPEAETAN